MVITIDTVRNLLAPTIKYYVAIATTVATDMATDGAFTTSKFGGFPYLPEGFSYPTNSRGENLYLLAQINFAEVPTLGYFPRSGILQFYIGEDELFGLNFDNQFLQDNFRVLFFSEPLTEQGIRDFSFLPETDCLPIYLDDSQTYLALSFQKGAAPISMADYNFDRTLNSLVSVEVSKEIGEFIDANYDNLPELNGDGHKLGGYPFFTQSDPRYTLADDLDSYVLLLQIDSDEQIMWGDSGVANFFIREQDLRNLDFSRVLYNWDCC